MVEGKCGLMRLSSIDFSGPGTTGIWVSGDTGRDFSSSTGRELGHVILPLRWGNWGAGRLSDMLKITQWLSGKTGKKSLGPIILKSNPSFQREEHITSLKEHIMDRHLLLSLALGAVIVTLKGWGLHSAAITHSPFEFGTQILISRPRVYSEYITCGMRLPKLGSHCWGWHIVILVGKLQEFVLTPPPSYSKGP